MGCLLWKATMVRPSRKNSGTDWGAAMTCPQTQNFPFMYLPNMAPILPEGSEKKWRKGKQKNIKYVREFCEQALGFKELEYEG